MSENEASVSRFWDFLSRQIVFEAPLWNWRQRLGDGIDFERFRRKYLVPTDQFSNLIICPKPCRSGCGFRKVSEFDGEYEAVCHEWPLNSFVIDRVNALNHELKIGDLLPAVAQALKIQTGIASFQTLDDSWLMGRLSVAGASVRVFLTLRNVEYKMIDLILNLNRMDTEKYILLVTSRELISPTSEGVLRDHGAVFIPLDEVLDFNRDAELVITSPLEPYLNLLIPAVSEPESEPDNIFRKCGDVWEVRFNGGEKFMLTTGHTGATYLHFMLARPNVATPVLEIIKSVSREFGNCVSADRLGEDDLMSGYSFSDLPSTEFEVIADEAAIRQYRQEAQILLREIEDARECGDNITAEQLQQDLDKLTAAINEVTSPVGQKKRFADQKKNIVDACRSAVNFAIDKIAAHDSSLAEHLRVAVRCGQMPGYFPRHAIDWNL